MVGWDEWGSERCQLTEKSIPALITRPLKGSLGHFVVGRLSSGFRRFARAKKMEGGGKICGYLCLAAAGCGKATPLPPQDTTLCPHDRPAPPLAISHTHLLSPLANLPTCKKIFKASAVAFRTASGFCCVVDFTCVQSERRKCEYKFWQAGASSAVCSPEESVPPRRPGIPS